MLVGKERQCHRPRVLLCAPSSMDPTNFYFFPFFAAGQRACNECITHRRVVSLHDVFFHCRARSPSTAIVGCLHPPLLRLLGQIYDNYDPGRSNLYNTSLMDTKKHLSLYIHASTREHLHDDESLFFYVLTRTRCCTTTGGWKLESSEYDKKNPLTPPPHTHAHT